jgi:hypothetical protein
MPSALSISALPELPAAGRSAGFPFCDIDIDYT